MHYPCILIDELGSDLPFLSNAKPNSLRGLSTYLAATFFAVLENNQQLFGFYALDFSPQGHVELRGLFVEPEFLGRGLGRFL